MRTRLTAALLAVLGLGLSTLVTAAGKTCDRECLEHMVDRYFAALVAHDPHKVPIAHGAKFVENTVPLKPGDGLWKTATAPPGSFKLYVPDPVAQQVGFLGVMQEDGKPVQIALRLKLENGRITEMEHLLARNLQGSSLANLQAPRPNLLAEVPAAMREPRDELLKIGASYYDALVDSKGSEAPFADDCVRRENGFQTTGNPPPAKPGRGTMGAMGCSAQLDTHVMSYIKRIEPRRVWIADPETGLVFGLSHFRHPMEEHTVKIVGVPGVTESPMNGRDGKPLQPFDLPAAHVFKVLGGKIHEIEAMGFTMPYDSKTGWE